MTGFLIIGITLGTLFIFFTTIILAQAYKRCPSNKILCVYGKLGAGKSVRCNHGGGSFVWPLIQDYEYLDLTPMTIHIPLKSALSFQNIRINVPSTFTVAIDTTPEAMNNAAVRLLGLSLKSIELMSTEIIIGQLRLTVASLRIEEINQDRERFLLEIRKHIDPELRKIGLTLLNVNITDIHDESGYIDSIGRKAVSTALNQAKVDVAEQEKRGDIGKAEAEKERRISVAAYNSDAVEGENSSQAKIAQFNAIMHEQEAIARQRGQIARQKAEAEINKARAFAEQSRLEAEQVVPQEVEKKRIEIQANAAAQKRKIEAEAEAAAVYAVKEAEARGIEKILAAKSEGYKQLVAACNNNTKDAATMLLVERLDHLVKLQTEAIKNIKIDKITVWDSGSGKKGSNTADFMSNMIKSLPPLHDVAAMSGIDLPEYLGKVSQDKVVAARQEPKEPKNLAQ